MRLTAAEVILPLAATSRKKSPLLEIDLKSHSPASFVLPYSGVVITALIFYHCIDLMLSTSIPGFRMR